MGLKHRQIGALTKFAKKNCSNLISQVTTGSLFLQLNYGGCLRHTLRTSKMIRAPLPKTQHTNLQGQTFLVLQYCYLDKRYAPLFCYRFTCSSLWCFGRRSTESVHFQTTPWHSMLPLHLVSEHIFNCTSKLRSSFCSYQVWNHFLTLWIKALAYVAKCNAISTLKKNNIFGNRNVTCFTFGVICNQCNIIQYW